MLYTLHDYNSLYVYTISASDCSCCGSLPIPGVLSFAVFFSKHFYLHQSTSSKPKVTVGQQVWKTSVHGAGGKAPIWNEETEFRISTEKVHNRPILSSQIYYSSVPCLLLPDLLLLLCFYILIFVCDMTASY